MNRTKKLLLCTAALVIINASKTYAAIPVIDPQNIAEQVKTYTQTLGVVKNTAEQIKLQIQNLQSLSEQALDKYADAIRDGMTSIDNTLRQANFLTSVQNFNERWNRMFQRIDTDNYPQTIESARNIAITTNEMLSQKDQNDALAIQKLTQELAKSQDRLQDLLQQNKYPVGSKQALQIANEIQIEKAHINSINTSIQAINAKNKLLHQQAAVIQRQNQQALQDAAAKAEVDYIKKLYNSTPKYTPAIDDPWQKYVLDKE